MMPKNPFLAGYLTFCTSCNDANVDKTLLDTIPTNNIEKFKNCTKPINIKLYLKLSAINNFPDAEIFEISNDLLKRHDARLKNISNWELVNQVYHVILFYIEFFQFKFYFLKNLDPSANSYTNIVLHSKI